MSGVYFDNDVCRGCIQCQSTTTSPSSKYYPFYEVPPLIKSTTFSSLTMMFARARIPHCLTCLGVKGQCNLIVTLWTRLLGPPDKGQCVIVTSQSRQLWPPQTGHCDQLNQPLRGPHLRLMQMDICWEEIKALKSRDGCNDFLKSLQIVGSGTPRFNHKNKSWMNN